MRLRQLFYGFLVLLLLGGVWMVLPDIDTIVGAVEWMRDAGPVGDVAFFLFFGLGTLLLYPASWNTGMAGFLYGPWVGALVNLVYATLFGSLSFLLGRSFLRGFVERRFGGNARFHALDRAIAQRGWPLVLLVRLSPISPFNPCSYALSGTRVSLRDFVIGTAIGAILPSLVWSQVGASVANIGLFLAGEATPPGWLQGLGLSVTLVVTVALTVFAKRAVDEALCIDDDDTMAEDLTGVPAPVRSGPSVSVSVGLNEVTEP